MEAQMLKPGMKIDDRYELVEPLCDRKRDVVWRAIDSKTERRVAVEIVEDGDGEKGNAVSDFLEIIKKISAIEHSNVVRIHDHGQAEDGRGFAVMEELEGCTLAARLAEEPALSLADFLLIISQALEGLVVLHDRGVVHGAIEPANIFLENTAGRPSVKLIGIGHSREGEDDREQAVDAEDSQLLRALVYAAPEQVGGDGSISKSADVYGMGAIVFHAVTGRLPHDGLTEEAIRQSILSKQPPLLHEVREEIPDSLSQVVAKAMESSSEARHASAKEMQQELLSSMLMAPEDVKKSALPLCLSSSPSSTDAEVEPSSETNEDAAKETTQSGEDKTDSSAVTASKPKAETKPLEKKGKISLDEMTQDLELDALEEIDFGDANLAIPPPPPRLDEMTQDLDAKDLEVIGSQLAPPPPPAKLLGSKKKSKKGVKSKDTSKPEAKKSSKSEREESSKSKSTKAAKPKASEAEEPKKAPESSKPEEPKKAPEISQSEKPEKPAESPAPEESKKAPESSQSEKPEKPTESPAPEESEKAPESSDSEDVEKSEGATKEPDSADAESDEESVKAADESAKTNSSPEDDESKESPSPSNSADDLELDIDVAPVAESASKRPKITKLKDLKSPVRLKKIPKPARAEGERLDHELIEEPALMVSREELFAAASGEMPSLGAKKKPNWLWLSAVVVVVLVSVGLTIVVARGGCGSGEQAGSVGAMVAADAAVEPDAPETAQVSEEVVEVPQVGAADAGEDGVSADSGTASEEADSGASEAGAEVEDASAEAEDAEPPLVTITLRGIPAGARVTVDDEPIEGRELQLPSDGAMRRVVVTAEGYRRWRQGITPREDTVLNVEMQRVSAGRGSAGRGGRRTGAGGRRGGPRRPTKSSSGLVRNPGF